MEKAESLSSVGGSRRLVSMTNLRDNESHETIMARGCDPEDAYVVSGLVAIESQLKLTCL